MASTSGRTICRRRPFATIVGSDAVVGFSTHTLEQIDAAIREPVTYIAIGPVFGTATKDTGYTAVGLEKVRYAAAALSRAAVSAGSPPRGLVAIGGITTRPRRGRHPCRRQLGGGHLRSARHRRSTRAGPRVSRPVGAGWQGIIRGILMRHQLFATKPLRQLLDEMAGENRLRRVLGPVQLTSLGVGAIIGAGIFVATGAAARNVAGPALMLSYVVAGVTCIFAALCYAEFASMVPVAGSAYTYAYATLGELFAWIIGWDLDPRVRGGLGDRRERLVRAISRACSRNSASSCRRRWPGPPIIYNTAGRVRAHRRASSIFRRS